MWRKVLISLYLALDIENNKQEQSDTAYLNRGESGLDPDSGSRSGLRTRITSEI